MTIEIDQSIAYAAACQKLGEAQTTIALLNEHIRQQDIRIQELETQMRSESEDDSPKA